MDAAELVCATAGVGGQAGPALDRQNTASASNIPARFMICTTFFPTNSSVIRASSHIYATSGYYYQLLARLSQPRFDGDQFAAPLSAAAACDTTDDGCGGTQIRALVFCGVSHEGGNRGPACRPGNGGGQRLGG
ncbi:MAG: hypothetical protein OEN55_12590 [Alphaproteobacteria bacterium]|nr:hypothetical protein [Alphaproteobacteria bacterium]